MNVAMSIRLRARFVLIITFVGLLSGCASIGGMKEEATADAQPVATFDELVKKGDDALRANDISGAQINYALAVEKDADNIAVVYKLAAVHKFKESFDVAEKLLRHALTIEPSNERSKVLLAQVLTQLERNDEAEVLYEEILARNERSLEALNGLGVLHDMNGRHKLAQNNFSKALSLDSRSAKLANNLGYSYYLAGDFNEADRLFLEAVKFDSKYDRAWSNLALVYSRAGRLRAADSAFRKIVPEYQAANNIGYIGLLQGDLELAAQQFNRAISTSPIYYETANRNLELLAD